ncbi:hypothetical protein [uncultured Cellulomonas sp.]|uniref:hypothetical protein n=1 Tax=uncultured Cellulomonas sp. TaxID=189682 RepID=UPI002612406D|nr:hypothetical protein [uncultured Cellulomonas sp.]
MSHGPEPYAVGNDPRWNERAAQSATVDLDPDEDDPMAIIVTGPCPRCTHESAHVEPLLLYSNLQDRLRSPGSDVLRLALEKAAGVSRRREVEVICACGTPHPSTPQGARGCGASWVLDVSWGAP